MKFKRVAAASLLAAAGTAWAAPATADAEVFGTYAFAAEDGESATWTLTPCADNAPGCVRVSEVGNPKRAPWSADAHWSVGSLILLVAQPDAILCDDGSAAPGTNTYSWGGSTLSGSVSILTNGACGKPASLSIPFRLTRLGAAEAQVPAVAPAAVAPAPATPAAPAAPASPAAPQPPAPAPEPLAAESTVGPAGAPPVPAPAG